MSKLDIKGLAWFLSLTFAATIAIAVVLHTKGGGLVSGGPLAAQLSLAAVMFVPGLASLFVRKFITREGWNGIGLRWGKFSDYRTAWVILLMLYVFVFGITWVAGFRPDFSLASFTGQFGMPAPARPGFVVMVILLATCLVTPIINSIPAFGEELGWRGYLLPKLLPLGERKALTIHGVIWGLWHVPLVLLAGFGSYSNPWLGSVLFVLMATSLGIYIGRLRLQTGSTLLASFAHGMFNAQAYGLWPIVFASFNHLIGGMGGVIGVVVLAVLAWVSLRPTVAQPAPVLVS